MIYSNDKPLLSLFLSWGISHWVLMSDYFTSRSAFDKWLRQAVKNRSKPLGWKRTKEGEGAVTPLNHFPPLPNRAWKMPPIIPLPQLIKAQRVIREQGWCSYAPFFPYLNKPLSLPLNYTDVARWLTVWNMACFTIARCNTGQGKEGSKLCY